MLSRVEVKVDLPMTEQHNRHLVIFYTSIYRSLLFPRRLDEVDETSGKIIHYSPYDNKGEVDFQPIYLSIYLLVQSIHVSVYFSVSAGLTISLCMLFVDS